MPGTLSHESSHDLPPAVRIPASIQMMLLLAARERFEEHLLRGPPTRTFKLPGLGRVVGIRDPADIKQLFTADHDAVRTGEVARLLLPGLGPDSVMQLDGERHLRMRRFLLPPFHGEAIKAYEALLEKIAVAEVERWPECRAFATLPAMRRIALESILRAVLGVRDERRAVAFRALLPKVLEVNGFGFIAEGRMPWLARGWRARALPWVRARRQVRAMLRQEIEEHRDSERGREDVLSTLIAARDESGERLSAAEIEDQLLTLLLAGHETTAGTLAFCFERLSRNPAALERLTQEVRCGKTTRYLEAVIDETQRLRPVVEIAWRVLAKPMELSGYVIPAGTIVLPTIRGLQRSEAFEDADAFRPERFLAGRPEPYTLIPFGGGTRRCLGASFARLEMKVVLRAAFERFDFLPTTRRGERCSRYRRITTIPARGGRVIVRRSAAAA